MRGGGGGGGIPLFFFSGSNRRIPLRFRQLSPGSFARIKPLLYWCLAFALLLLLLLCRRPSHSSGTSLCPGKGYTILINTWKRNDLLKQSVVHYASCVGVESIHIVWSEPDQPSDSLCDALWQAAQLNSRGCNGTELRFDLNEEDSLNNRFKEIMDLETDAIFSIDDDVLFPCASVELAFRVWQSAPSTMVGFVPRMHRLDRMKGNEEYYRYGGWWSVWWMGTYSMVLSKAAFFHRRYLNLYTNHMPASIRHYVTKYRNCEDIAMSFLVANTTGSPPIWVKGCGSQIDDVKLDFILVKRIRILFSFPMGWAKKPFGRHWHWMQRPFNGQCRGQILNSFLSALFHLSLALALTMALLTLGLEMGAAPVAVAASRLSFSRSGSLVGSSSVVSLSLLSASTPLTSAHAPPPSLSINCGRGDKKTAKGKRFKHSFGNARPRDKTKGRGPPRSPVPPSPPKKDRFDDGEVVKIEIDESLFS
ncbi:glycosylinositol phosphorylceramide mannosyl transferase 1-like isoform X2 [Musa acuminata AAA Group]|uniref:glycosylinositol phosphorylceramide mannosyl transferase 1-like isoform X2 n=1 Tax=Musa acuminata AAA Group TaxID=214697 RepID=UPI0031D5C94D